MILFKRKALRRWQQATALAHSDIERGRALLQRHQRQRAVAQAIAWMGTRYIGHPECPLHAYCPDKAREREAQLRAEIEQLRALTRRAVLHG